MGDGTRPTRRSKPSTQCMIRSLPSSAGSGGSSGCIASTTSASSATGSSSSRNASRFTHSWSPLAPGSSSARNGSRPGIRADSTLGDVERRDLGATALGCVDPGADPVGAGHEVVADHGNAELAEMAHERLHLLHLGAVVAPELEVVDRQVALDDAQTHPERLDPSLGLVEQGEVVAGIAADDLLHPRLGGQGEVVVGERGENRSEFHGTSGDRRVGRAAAQKTISPRACSPAASARNASSASSRS